MHWFCDKIGKRFYFCHIMAHIKFYIRSKKNPVTIYVRVKISGKKDLAKSTRKYISYENWNKKKGYPKHNNPKNNQLISELKDLELFIINHINQNEKLQDYWLSDVIDRFYNKGVEVKKEVFNNYVDYYCDSLKHRRGDKEVSLSSLRKYNNIRNKIKKFDAKGTYKISDVNLDYREKFIDYLINEEKLATNTIGRQIKFVKTILLDAQKRGFQVSPDIADFKGFAKTYEMPVLSFEELKIIEKTTYSDQDIANASKWLIIGCYTGQRVSDLLRMNESMINKVGGKRFIELKQQKTKKKVQIPIHGKVEEIIKDGFPPSFGNKISSQAVEFNELIKKVGYEAGITQLQYGGLRSKSEGRTVYREYPKYKLITSHICRRSFATNFYGKIPTPLLMAITGHTTEKSFLIYINKPNLEFSLMLSNNDFWNK